MSSISKQLSIKVDSVAKNDHLQNADLLNSMLLLSTDAKVMECSSPLHVLEIISKSQSGALAEWFMVLFEDIYPSQQEDAERFASGMQLFAEFIEICLRYNIESYLAKPDKLPFLFKLFDTDYLRICIVALKGSKNKKMQAQLLDQLPDISLIEDAFANGLPFVCAAMTYNDTIQQQSYSELANVGSYGNYKSNVLVYIAMTPCNLACSLELSEANNVLSLVDELIQTRVDFVSCLKFINILDEISSNIVSTKKKQVLLSKFVTFLRQFRECVNVSKFIAMANKLKEISECKYYEKLFGSPMLNSPENETNCFISLSQYLMHSRTAMY
jgi:hypothetical protein